MIEFLGYPLLGKIPFGSEQMNLGTLCSVSEERCKEIVDALMLAKKEAFVKMERVRMPDMDPIMGEHFDLSLLLRNVCIDTNTPAEIMLVGLLIGRFYTEMEIRAAESDQRVRKMVALYNANPAKALRKMDKDMKKLANKK